MRVDKLFFGSFAKILHKYFKRYSAPAFSKHLLKSGIDDKNYSIVDTIHDTDISKCRSKGIIPSRVLEHYDNPNVYQLVFPYFSSHLIVREDQKPHLLHKLLILISSDSDIAFKKRKEFERLAKPATFYEFLSEVFIYAIDKESTPSENFREALATMEDYILTSNSPRWENAHVLGRDKFVAELCSELQIGTPHIQLTGMGGIGKSEILNKVYVQFADNLIEHHFDHVGLLFYDGTMDVAMNQLLCNCSENGREIEKWTYLRNLCERCSILLLIDDIRPQQEKKVKSQTPDKFFLNLFSIKATVLLASRVLVDSFTGKTVGTLPTEDCIQIFESQRHLDRQLSNLPALSEEDMGLLTEIIEKLAGRNTLIVNRFGAMARDYNWNIQDLADRLVEKEFDIRKGLDDDEKLQEEINKLYNFEYIEDLAEKSILEAFALFPVIPLELGVCIEWLREDAGLDEDDLRLALHKLSKHTWLIQHDSDNNNDDDEENISFSMHQMVMTAVAGQVVSIKIENHQNLIEQCRNDLYQSNAREQPYTPFALSLAEYFHAEENLALMSLMNWVGWHKQSTEWYQRALAICVKISANELLEAADLYRNIANTSANNEEYVEALEWYHKSLTIREEALGENHIYVAQICKDLAFVFTCQEEYSQALEWYQRHITIIENSPHANSRAAAVVYFNMAKIAYAQKDLTQAIILSQKALKNRKKAHEDNNEKIADIHEFMGIMYEEMGDYPHAVENYEKALEIYSEELGEKSSATVIAYENLTLCHLNQGDYSRALELSQELIGIYENIPSTDYPNIIKALGGGVHYFIAVAYAGLGKRSEALNYYQENCILDPERSNYNFAWFSIAMINYMIGDSIPIPDFSREPELEVAYKVFSNDVSGGIHIKLTRPTLKDCLPITYMPLCCYESVCLYDQIGPHFMTTLRQEHLPRPDLCVS